MRSSGKVVLTFSITKLCQDMRTVAQDMQSDKGLVSFLRRIPTFALPRVERTMRNSESFFNQKNFGSPTIILTKQVERAWPKRQEPKTCRRRRRHHPYLSRTYLFLPTSKC